MDGIRIESLVLAGFGALPMQAAVLDDDGVIVYTNREWREFGEDNGLVGPSDAIGTNYISVCDASEGEDAATVADELRSMLVGDRESFTYEYPCHGPDRQRWFTLRARRFEHEGERYLLVVHTDITDRKLAEMRTEEKVDQLETVAGLLSHDLRNPLAVALGHVEILASADQPGVAEHVETIRSALERMETILDDALVLARHDRVTDTRTVNLEDAADRCWTHVDTGNAILSVEASALFRADPGLLDHVFENLFRNSVEHSSTGSRTQSDDSVEHGAQPASGRSTPGDGEESSVTIRVGPLEDGFYVEDDGPGIPDRERESVFEIGHTTGSGGSGLGLAIVARIASAHGWEIAVTDSELGGARFEFTGVDPQ